MYIHVTLGCVDTVVEGLDGHPAHRQPPLEAVKHDHIEKEVENVIIEKLLSL